MLGMMDASDKWIIIWLTPHQINTQRKWMFFQKPFFKSSLLLNGQCDIQELPPNSSDDLCLLFCLFLLLWITVSNSQEKQTAQHLRNMVRGWKSRQSLSTDIFISSHLNKKQNCNLKLLCHRMQRTRNLRHQRFYRQGSFAKEKYSANPTIFLKSFLQAVLQGLLVE